MGYDPAKPPESSRGGFHFDAKILLFASTKKERTFVSSPGVTGRGTQGTSQQLQLSLAATRTGVPAKPKAR